MRTQTVAVYRFDELSPKAQEKVLYHFYEWMEFDSEYVIDYIKEAGAALGIRVDDVDYEVGDRGDYAVVTGLYMYKKGWRAALKAVSGSDELLRIGKELQEVQRKHFYKLYSFLSKGLHFYSKSLQWLETGCEGISGDFDAKYLEVALRDFSDWALAQLTAEYEFVYSDENIKDFIEANEYEFYEDGNIL